jgi:NAD(P)-dependent dehydrogenase (short-subunit alcohol dehydrogenase family)
MDLELAGKTALVTGGSRGIGKAVARLLAQEGVDLAIAARNSEVLQTTARELAEETGRTIVPLQVDTTSDDSVQAMVQQARLALGHIDILVNAAAKAGGISRPPKLAEITEAEFLDEMQTKVLGYLRCCREVAPGMVERGWGRIINISGLAARRTGTILGSMRNVSVAALSKNLADELGPHGVNVTTVHPGETMTEIKAELVKERAEAEGVSEQEMEARMFHRNIARRTIVAQDIAYVVVFLASPRSVAINGDTIAAGGGAPGPIFY